MRIFWANDMRLRIERYTAKWSEFGKSAGPKRNKQMAILTDYVICFWDGKSEGTKSMIKYTLQFNKPIRIKYINQKSDNLVFTF